MTSPETPPQSDRILRAMTDDGAFRVMTLRCTDTVREAVATQDSGGIPAAQLGELIAAAVLIRETMAPPYRVQVLLRDKAGSTVLGDAFPEGRTRGLIRVEDDVLGVRLEDGGNLQVMRSLPRRAPHQGVVDVTSEGGISAALVHYFLQSEQVETMAAVACVVDGEEIRAAGGYVVQLLPELTAPPLDAMRQRLDVFGDLAPVMVARDADPHWLLEALLDQMPHTGLAESSVEYGCTCGRERAIGAVAALGEAELRDMLDKGEVVPVKCDYCTTSYDVTPDDVRRILEPDPPADD